MFRTMRFLFLFLLLGPSRLVWAQVSPEELSDGLTYQGDSTVFFKLTAPGKSSVALLGDFNNWDMANPIPMTRSQDGEFFWAEIHDLTPGIPYAYQFLVDGALKVADPYAELILDPEDDPFISPGVFPNLPPYPLLTSGNVSVLQIGQEAYNWQTEQWPIPEASDLVIYELLVRDFLADHSYLSLIDSLDYLESLGINAIELLPVGEFEANISWGYNPSFHLAPDKYYGTENALKAFIDSCHARGMVVLLDMVLNHAFGESPLAQLYWDSANNRPSEDNPWLNPQARHPFNVGYDFNHESLYTQAFVDDVLDHWITEFRFDGYRLDLSKGFTQVFSTDAGVWSQYDASRIALLKRMAEKVWERHPDALLILEHFGDNQEERELEAMGFLLWGNGNFNFNEATMGYHDNGKSDFSWLLYTARGWQNPHLVGYMESHDEERLMYKNLQFGNAANGYDVKDLGTALDRVELAATFFFSIPGPKMLWQFGELGYEIPIDENGRTGPKPIRWEYLQNPDRKDLYEHFSKMIHLKRNNNIFNTNRILSNFNGPTKRLTLENDEMSAVVLGNFDVIPRTLNPGFPGGGTWYEFFSGDSLENTGSISFVFDPGEYRLYSSRPLNLESTDMTVSNERVLNPEENTGKIFPNPISGHTLLSLSLKSPSQVKFTFYTMQGKQLFQQTWNTHPAGDHVLKIDFPTHPLPSGVYLGLISIGTKQYFEKLWIK